jgi:hypothetical protein
MATHLNVLPNKIVNLQSFTIAPDNSLGNKFFYDRQADAPFVVPKGWSFIVTDIIVFASPLSGPIPDPNRFVFAVVSFTNGSERNFQASVFGDESKHFGLTSAIVIPPGHEPQFRNTTFSNSYAEAQLLGYFAEGSGLGPGEQVTFF